MALNLKAMEYFTTALCHGNIPKAAAELNIAASAVSTAINQVEAEFDLTLVTRHRAFRQMPTGVMLHENAPACWKITGHYWPRVAI
jgi:DNA-binding transcriptional LysR family regulator